MNYFDYAATTPMSAIALKVYLETAEKYYGNPSAATIPLDRLLNNY